MPRFLAEGGNLNKILKELDLNATISDKKFIPNLPQRDLIALNNPPPEMLWKAKWILELNNGGPNIVEIDSDYVNYLSLDTSATYYVISSEVELNIDLAVTYMQLCHASWEFLYKRVPTTLAAPVVPVTEECFPVGYRRDWDSDTVVDLLHSDFSSTYCVKRSINDWTDDFSSGEYACLKNRRVFMKRNASADTNEIGIIMEVNAATVKVEFADAHTYSYEFAQVILLFICN